MKQVICLLLAFTSITIKAQDATLIYTYDNQGRTIPKSQFVQALDYVEQYLPEGVTWLHEADCTVMSSDKTYQYNIQLQKMEGAEDLELFEAIDITCKGKKILSLHCMDAWAANFPLENGTASGYFTIKHLDLHVTALVLLGWCYNTDLPWITIILLNKDTATIVFNQRGNIQECTNAEPYGLNMIYTDCIQEFKNANSLTPTPPDSELKKYRIWQEGQYLKYARIQ